MAFYIRSTLLAFVATGLLGGCASTPYSPTPFEPATVDTSGWIAGVDAFVVVMDASSSMDFDYEDRSNFDSAKDVASNMNQTIPELGYRAALVSFGTGSCNDRENAVVLYGPATYQRADFADGIARLECAGGRTPMAQGMDTGGEAVSNTTGRVAMILVSDFWDISRTDVIEAADRLHAAFGDQLCIHTIKVGGPDTAADLRAALAGINGCGSSFSAQSLATPVAMAGYVTDVLLEPAPPAPVPAVRYEKNILSTSALFDLDSAVLKDDGKVALRELGDTIKSRGAEVVDINIVGHTDSTGAEDYNMALSLRRAEAVRDFIVAEGIDASIIDVSGEGESSPVASNATREGRAQNRRVEIHVGIQERSY